MKKQGFTLIELLIVVAIIGILAAIAVPNFLNAQIRAKCTRAVSDMNTLEKALEMYRLDCNNYPPATEPRVPGSVNSWHPNEVRLYRLTTPVSYITSIPQDPFALTTKADFATWGWAYDYVGPDQGGWKHVWRLNSWGPDGVNGWGGQRDGRCPNGKPDFLYQLSNGLTSKGDIVWVGAKSGPKNTSTYCNIINGV